MGDSFTHLHVHTEFSMLDSAARLDELVAKAAQDGQPALGITDQIPEALARGGDVVIPLAKYITEAGKSDLHKAWREDVRLEADGREIAVPVEELLPADAAPPPTPRPADPLRGAKPDAVARKAGGGA